MPNQEANSKNNSTCDFVKKSDADERDSTQPLSDSGSLSSHSTSSVPSVSQNSAEYMQIGSENIREHVIDVSNRRRALREENRQERINILSSLKTDIAAASAKLYVTVQILSRAFAQSEDALPVLERGRRILPNVETAVKSVCGLARETLPNWR